MARKRQRRETLRHDPTLGEVDPRTYFLLCAVQFETKKLGSEPRGHEIRRLLSIIDTICSDEGDKQVRVHLTLSPGVSGLDRVEVRLQPTTLRQESAERGLFDRVKDRIDEIEKAGEDGGWTVLPQ